MNRKLVTDSIVDTYELPQMLKESVRRIAHWRIDELSISKYDSIYGYIASLVDKFQTPYEERFFVRLDSQINDNSRRLYHDICSIENSNQRTDWLEREDLEGISLDDVVDVLNSYLDPPLLNLIKQLGNGNSNILKFNTSLEHLIKNASKIREKLENLLKKYGENISVIKTRQIRYVQFSPFSIKFKRRNYYGDPLAFFISHREFYPENLSRRVQLKKIDEPLYAALRRHNQIDKAIPFEREYREILPEKKNAIVEAYKECRSSPKVSKEFSVSTATVIKYCRRSGLEIREKGFIAKKSKEEKSEIVKVYKKYKSSSKVAKEFNISPKTVIRYCKEYDVKILAPGSNQRKIKYRKQKVNC